ncbi:hypothetical protein AcW2_007460 [Taiwanofungus camphoratus]|nr:hypothetical protein AcW2_007460 [Antrodia cinnamomea]
MVMQSRTCSSSSVGSDGVSDGIYNYEVHEVIGRGATSIVHRATCKRGRLRNRQVALKKILPVSPDSTTEIAHLASSTALHQALHHPSIVSLLSTFSTPSGHYHVLELCPQGTLSVFVQQRKPPVLSEGELRGVVKCMVEALIYLRKERVLHRDIKASNILLTDDFRIKLSDFGLATRLPEPQSTVSTFCGSPNYIAPEIISRTPYGFNADLWSLGCLMVTCLSGVPAFEAPSVQQIFENISCGNYNLPGNTSAEARDLISRLLQLNPTHRISPHLILSHPFLSPSLPLKRLNFTSNSSIQSRQHFQSENDPIHRALKHSRYPRSLSKAPARFPQPPLQSSSQRDTLSLKQNRRPMTDITNVDVRNFLNNELLSSEPLTDPARKTSLASKLGQTSASHLEPAPRMVFSEFPTLHTAPALAPDTESPLAIRDAGRHVTNSVSGVGELNGIEIRYALRQMLKRHEANELQPKDPMSCLRPSVEADSMLSVGSHRESVNAASDVLPAHVAPVIGSLDRRQKTAPSPVSAVPAGSTQPTLFKTAYLNAQTHKLAQGQLVVLPSKSLLVDFREGERRKGRRGNEVLVISPEGDTVRIYGAPHLSTPCCLAEPLATHTLEDLPSSYWKLYSDAGRVVNQLKQRIPKLTMYKPEARCTLMANEPLGDIELVVPPFDRQCRSEQLDDNVASGKGPNMRIRLLRRSHIIEIARHIPPASRSKERTGEWLKKVFSAAGDEFGITNEDWATLEPVERAGIQHLAEFLRVCEAVEALGLNDGPSVRTDMQHVPKKIDTRHSTATDLRAGRKRLENLLTRMDNRVESALPGTLTSGDVGSPSSVATAASSKILPSLNLLPRPSKFVSAPSNHSEGINRDDATEINGYLSTNPRRPDANSGSQPLSRSAGAGAETQTRYIPGTGWCVRYASPEAEWYKIMFQDGVSLEINPGQDTVRLENGSGSLARYTFRRALVESEVAGRMKAFYKFLALFSSGES